MATRAPTISSAPSIERSPLSVAAWASILFASLAAIYIEARSGFEGQAFLVVVAVVSVLALMALPKMARRDGAIPLRFLAVALAAHLVGSFLRYYIIQTVYHGLADANGYYGQGKVLAATFRMFSVPPLHHPYFGTPFLDWLTGLEFAITGTMKLGAFAVHAAFGFIGGWYFYKAFRLSFPEGNHRLYAALIFLLPTMWYWPSSLGKDSLMVLFLGLATYGFALVLRGGFLKGLLVAVFGLAGGFMIRPPIAAGLAVAGAAAFLVRPARGRSPGTNAITWLVFVPVLSFVAFFAVKHTTQYLGTGSPVAAFQAQQNLQFSTGSNFTAPNPFTPVGFPVALVTSNLRPFPWEAGGFLPALASLEGVFLLGLILYRRREIWRGLKTWRQNGMVILALGAFLALSVILASLSNFGLLARQRTQVLPFLFMLIAVYGGPTRRQRRRSEARARPGEPVEPVEPVGVEAPA